MSILINQDTKVLVQGITGHDGSFHTRQMLDYGTKVVAGVTPGKGGQDVFGVPVFNSVLEAKNKTKIKVMLPAITITIFFLSILYCSAIFLWGVSLTILR